MALSRFCPNDPKRYTSANGMNEHTEKTIRIIRDNRYLTLAVASGDDVWASPLAYVCDSEFKFYWYSAVSARHSILLTKNPKVAVAIFNSQEPSDSADGVQMHGQAFQLPEADLERVIQIYFEQSFLDPKERARWVRPKSDFLGNAPQRFYYFQPDSVFKCDPESRCIDRRIEVLLRIL